MRFHRSIGVVVALLVSLLGRAAVADQTADIRKTSEAFVTAFNTGDAKTVAALWTPDGQLVDSNGKTYSGRAAIEAAYAKFFQDHPHEKIKISIDSVQMLSDDAALETGTATLEPATGNTGGAKYTAIHVKSDGKWLMALVHEGGNTSPTSQLNLQDLDWLVGEWTGEEYGARSDIVCRWLPNRSFLERKYKVTTADGTKSYGLQIIGLNPHSGQIESWGFDSDGSRTTSAWLPQPGGWAIDASGLLSNGTETHAVNLLTKLDDNAYSWKSVKRSAGSEPRPDTDEVILKRVVPVKPAK